MDTREETTDTATQRGRLLVFTDEHRRLAALSQVFLTGSALRHLMPLTRVRLLMQFEMHFLRESLSTHVAREPDLMIVNRLLMILQGIRPFCAKVTAVVGTSHLLSLVLRASVAAKVTGCRRSVAASLDGTDEASILLVNSFDVFREIAFL